MEKKMDRMMPGEMGFATELSDDALNRITGGTGDLVDLGDQGSKLPPQEDLIETPPVILPFVDEEPVIIRFIDP